MAKPAQDTPDGGLSQSAEPELRGESSSVKPGRTAEDSAERRENQAKPAEVRAKAAGILPIIAEMQRRIEDLLTEKERHMLSFIHGKVPRPYYVSWKAETNMIFRQAVAINTRRMAISRRTVQERNAKAKTDKKPA